jgi:nickel-dependent lactate racemase
MDVALPYGRTLLYGRLPESVRVKNVTSREWPAVSQDRLVKAALESPIGTLTLRHLAKNKRRVVIVTSDKTRGAPSQITIPIILSELRTGGVTATAVTLVIATGLHKGETMSDLRERLPGDVIDNLDVIIHDSDNHDQLTSVGNLQSGAPLLLNRAVIEADLVVVESTVEPHMFAGFTGGSKMILPGLAGTDTILANHGWRNIDDSRSHYGAIDNPVRSESNEALRHLGKVFSLNLILDKQKRIVFANSGEIVASFVSAAEEVARHCKIQIVERPDVVLTTNGGYPLDRNFYQCVKGIAVPEEVVQKTSRIIMVGECSDGVAHQRFLELMQSGTPSEIYRRIRSSDVPVCDQWQVQILCRILEHNPVWFVTRNELKSEIESANMQYASTVEEALSAAKLTEGELVLTVPEGPALILKPADNETGGQGRIGT